VLAACYRHPILSKFIRGATLKELFARTIRAFELIAVPTSSLMIDMNILKGIAEKLGFPSGSDGLSSSFSSNPAPAIQRSPEGYSPSNMYSPGTPVHSMMPPPQSNA
jgi:hypothetical protein